MSRITLPQLQRISPSSADELERCPWAWNQLRVEKAAARIASRPMIRGSVFHEFVESALMRWIAGEDLTPELIGHCLGEAASGRLTDAERAELDGAAKWFRPPCSREDVVVVEPCIRPKGDGPPSPHPTWLPVTVNSFAVWGIPDVVYLDEAGRPVILDWKTGFAPRDPDGFAPGVYGAMLYAHWASLCEGPLAWPIRVVWRFVMLGKMKGTREAVFELEDVEREIGRLEALVHTAQGWHDAGKWPCLLNQYCASCPFMGGCPAWEAGAASGAPTESIEAMAERVMRLEAESKRAEAEADPLRELLKSAACAGERVVYPDGKVLAITNGSVRWSLRTREDLLALLEACEQRGVDPMALLTVDGRTASTLGLKDDPTFARFRTPDERASITVRRVAS